LDYAAHSDLLLRLAWWGGIGALALTFLLLTQGVLLRAQLMLRQRRERRFNETWRPIMAQALFEIPDSLPRLPARSIRQFLQLWIHLMELLRGEGTRNLTRLAVACGMDRAARACVEKRSMTDRVLGLLALTHMAQERDWELMLDHLGQENPLLSQIAARGLTHIRPREAIPLILAQSVQRKDWSSVRIANILEEAGPDAVTAPFLQFATQLPSEQIPLLLPYLHTIHETELQPLLFYWLQTEQSPEVLVGCLKAVRDPLALPAVRRLAGHADWAVRVHAASALGRIGLEEDRARLVALLSDREWWVRYRAAQALVSLPGMNAVALRALQAGLTDPYGRDILAQVSVERGLV